MSREEIFEKLLDEFEDAVIARLQSIKREDGKFTVGVAEDERYKDAKRSIMMAL